MLDTFIKSQLYTRKSPNLKKLGFDFSKPVDEEFRRIQLLISTEYNVKCESMLTIMKKYKIPSSRTMDILFRLFAIDSRSFSDSIKTALVTVDQNQGVENFNTFTTQPGMGPLYIFVRHTS